MGSVLESIREALRLRNDLAERAKRAWEAEEETAASRLTFDLSEADDRLHRLLGRHANDLDAFLAAGVRFVRATVEYDKICGSKAWSTSEGTTRLNDARLAYESALDDVAAAIELLDAETEET